MNVDIAKNLADRRRAAGLSQEGLAEKLGVTRQAVSKWERSESSPDTDNLIALAQLYGVSLDDLLYAKVEPLAEVPTEGVVKPSSEDVEAEFPAKDAVLPPAGSGAELPLGDATESSSEGIVESSAKNAEHVHIGFDGIHAEHGCDFVHVSWREGVHVFDGEKGDEVHVGWDGVHVNDKTYRYDDPGWHARVNHDMCNDAGQGRNSSFLHAWRRFPFPLVVIIAYVLCGALLGKWGEGLLLAFLIPLYYLVGSLVATRRIDHFVMSVYPVGAVAWFCYMAFILNQPHPAWVVFLTIPLVEWLVAALSRGYRKARRERQRNADMIDVSGEAD